MKCKSCGAKIQDKARFCQSCGSSQTSTEGKGKPTAERFKEVGEAVQKSTDTVVKISRKVGDGASRAMEKTKVVSADVSEKVGIAVDKTKELGGVAAVKARKVREGVGKAVKQARAKAIEDGRIGAVNAERALDVADASLKAVEAVENWLRENDSSYEVGSYTAGVAVHPYLEIQFRKRIDDAAPSKKPAKKATKRAGTARKTTSKRTAKKVGTSRKATTKKKK